MYTGPKIKERITVILKTAIILLIILILATSLNEKVQLVVKKQIIQK
jgi:hypothetical protein